MIRKPRKKFGGALGEAFAELWEAVEAGQIVESDSMTVEKTTRGTVVRARGGGEIGEDGSNGANGQQGESGAAGLDGAAGIDGQQYIYYLHYYRSRLLNPEDFANDRTERGMSTLDNAWWYSEGLLIQKTVNVGTLFVSDLWNFYPYYTVSLDGSQPTVGVYNLIAFAYDTIKLKTDALEGFGASGMGLEGETIDLQTNHTLTPLGFGFPFPSGTVLNELPFFVFP